MTWDLRNLYNFDAAEGQIPEGFASVYGIANSHANCVPASFTAALSFVGFPDLDPQEVTNAIYGPNYRGGFGTFARIIAWLHAPGNFPNAPAFTDGGFDFAAADAAGANGQIVIVAGWIDAPSVRFVAQSQATPGFSHASLLVAHTTTDKWIIWNTWTGQLQTYDRAVLAASLYEMSIMAPGAHGGGTGSLGGFLMGLSDAEQTEALGLMRNIAGAIGTYPGQTLGRDLAALLKVFGVTSSKAGDPTGLVPTNNPDYLGWTRVVSASLAALSVASATPGALTPAQAQELQDIADKIKKVFA